MSGGSQHWKEYLKQARETPAIIIALVIPILAYVLLEAILPVVFGLKGISFAREQFQMSADLEGWRRGFFFLDSGVSQSDIDRYFELGLLAGALAGIFVLARVLLFFVIAVRILLRLFRVWTISYKRNPPSNEVVRQLCCELATRMGVEASRLEFRDEVSFKLGATIRKRGSKIILLISLATQHLGRKDPEMLKAIVAHELGHVIQGDVRFWDVADAVRVHLTKYFDVYVLKIAGWGTILLGLALMGLMHDLSLFKMFLVVGIAAVVIALTVALPSLVFSEGLMWLLALVRKRSEHLADTAASIKVGEEALARALGRLRDNPGDMVHPSREARLAYVRNRALHQV